MLVFHFTHQSERIIVPATRCKFYRFFSNESDTEHSRKPWQKINEYKLAISEQFGNFRIEHKD